MTMSIFRVYVALVAIAGLSMPKGKGDPNVTRELYSHCSAYPLVNASALKANLRPVLASLRNSVSSKGGGIASQGQDTDPVYGLAQCRTDLSLNKCVQCFDNAEKLLPVLCSTQNGGRLYLDGCFLRYENATFFGTPFDGVFGKLCNISSISNSTGDDKAITRNLLVKTAGKAFSNNSFGIGWATSSLSSRRIYALAQCWVSLSSDGCRGCLQEAQNLIDDCLQDGEAQALEAGCYLRYATYPFFSLYGINREKGETSNSKTLGVILGTIGGIVLAISALFAYYKFRNPSFCSHRQNRERLDQELSARENSGVGTFDYEELREATRDFHVSNIIGQGGFGQVFKGIMRNGREIAVKRVFLSESSRAMEEFFTEIELIRNVRHRNLVTLLGCCTRGNENFLVFEYMANGSLDQHLFGEKGICLMWEVRFNIILSTARGLAYLHEYSHVRIVHRDIKAANILLDDKLQPKITDFGLARLFPDDRTHLTTKVGGTLGYTAPEYAVHGHLTEKADVYSYGVVVLEIVSGRKCIETKLPVGTQLLLHWAWGLYQTNEALGIVDPRLEGLYDAEQVLRVIQIALLCTQDSPARRPSMSGVVSMLTTDSKALKEPTQPAFLRAGNEYVTMASTSQSV